MYVMHHDRKKTLLILASMDRSGCMYSKTCVRRSLSGRPKFGFQDQLSLNTGQKNCRMLQGENIAILSTFIKISFVINLS